jgi:Tfp pilus assembly protein PilV
MLKGLKDKGFASIVEVIVTAVVFMIASFGILTTISMLRPHGMESYRKLEAAYHAKNMIDTLHLQVDAASWAANTGPLATGMVHTNTVGGYTINWMLVEPGGFPAGLAPRKMTMNVYFPD